METAINVLDTGFELDNFLYFGEFLHMDSSVLVETEGTDGKSFFDGEEVWRGVVPIQLDDIREEDLVDKGNNVCRRWSI